MEKCDIHILCAQETRETKAEDYDDENSGSRIILSGVDADGMSWSGVGFIVSPNHAPLIESYRQISDRKAQLKIKIGSRVFGIFCVRAPRSLKPLPGGR
eukprot:6761436-Pyramimonas_sp.AAC.1